MEFLRSEDFMVMAAPVAVYWVYSGVYELLRPSLAERYRLHSRRDEEDKNLVSRSKVVKGVLLQQAIQVSITFIILQLIKVGDGDQGIAVKEEEEHSIRATNLWDIVLISRQFLVAMVVLDTWQYFMHRLMHRSRFLYRHIHSWHHRLVVPYAFGAQYNHPLDGLLTETASGAAAFFASGMSPRAAVFFFSFATAKGIDDHCGLMIPWNPFHAAFANNAAYHDVHHQLAGSRWNYSQPFFVVWDRIFGTYAPPPSTHDGGAGDKRK